MHFQGGKNPKNCKKWLILPIIPSFLLTGEGGQVGGGKASNGGANSPMPPLMLPLLTFKKNVLYSHF